MSQKIAIRPDDPIDLSCSFDIPTPPKSQGSKPAYYLANAVLISDFGLLYYCHIPNLILTHLPLGHLTLTLTFIVVGNSCLRWCIYLWTAITNGSVSLMIMNSSLFRPLLRVAECLGCAAYFWILFTCCEFEEVLMLFWIGSSSVLVLPILSTAHFSRHDFFISMSLYLILG